MISKTCTYWLSYTIANYYSGLVECSNFAYSVSFFFLAGGRVKQSPWTLQQELAGGKSFKLMLSLWRLIHSTTRHALTEKPNIANTQNSNIP